MKGAYLPIWHTPGVLPLVHAVTVPAKKVVVGLTESFPSRGFSSFPWPQPPALHTNQTHACLWYLHTKASS